MNNVLEISAKAKKAAYKLALKTSDEKNRMLEVLAQSLIDNMNSILKENKKDIEQSEQLGKPQSFIDRLSLSESRINGMSAGLIKVSKLNDPVGEVLSSWTADSGIRIKKVRVPIGVVGIIYEARPNVTADVAGLCLKSGNAVVLRGSKDAICSNRKIVEVMKKALLDNGFDNEFIQFIDDTSRESSIEMMRANGLIDVLIPRGSAGLINSCVQNSTIPVIETGTGNCHVYVNKDADIDKAIKILINAKAQRVSVCNACESLLIDDEVASKYLPVLSKALKEHNVGIYGCEKTLSILSDAQLATEEDFYKEYLDYKISVKVVSGVEEAVAHINKFSTHHSEVIITENTEIADKFTAGVDSACVYVNASIRFSDGEQFGFGAEMGISTQKIHARGPVGLAELTSYKYIINGNGEVRA